MSYPLPRRRALITSLIASMAALPPLVRAASAYAGIDITGSGIGPDLSLTYPNGKPAALRDFRGKYVMLFFGFTQCPDVCPTTLARAVEIKQKLGADGDKLQVVFVTIDPERDTGPLLDEYMHAFDPGFVAMRGNAEQTAKAAKDFKIFYRKVPSGSSYTMDHTALSYVLDASGKVRLALRHEQTAQQCADDLRLLMHPPKEGGFLKGLFK